MSLYFALAVPVSILVAVASLVQCGKPKKTSNERAPAKNAKMSNRAGSKPPTPADGSEKGSTGVSKSTPGTPDTAARTPAKNANADGAAQKPQPADKKATGKEKKTNGSPKSDDTDLRSLQMDQLKEAQKREAHLLHQNPAAQNRSARLQGNVDEPGGIMSGYAAPQPLNAVVPTPAKQSNTPAAATPLRFSAEPATGAPTAIPPQMSMEPAKAPAKPK
ncbi:hypothetical protein AAVH_04574 [Aphelenchoides avenae]|nr:hypothetical protein AAVH_04574 [Aphelenchus avenae]